MPNSVSIPFSTIPNELIELILEKSDPEEKLELVKTNHFLRDKILFNGVFGKRVHAVEIDFKQRRWRRPKVIPRPSVYFTVTLRKNSQYHKFTNSLPSSLSFSLLQKITTCHYLFLNEYRVRRRKYGNLDKLLRVLLRKLNFVGKFHISGLRSKFLNTICEGVRFKVTESANLFQTSDMEVPRDSVSTNFVEIGLKFCRKIKVAGFSENLLNALLKTRVEVIEIEAEKDESLECFPAWIMKNGLPSEKENCSILISVRFPSEDPDISVIDPFTHNPLLKSEEDMEICGKMKLAMSEIIEVDGDAIAELTSVQCFRKSDCVDDLRFFMARETNSAKLEDEFETLHFFVKRLK